MCVPKFTAPNVKSDVTPLINETKLNTNNSTLIKHIKTSYKSNVYI